MSRDRRIRRALARGKKLEGLHLVTGRQQGNKPLYATDATRLWAVGKHGPTKGIDL